MKKQPKNYQKSIKNRLKNDLGAVLEAKWTHIAFGLGILWHLGGLLGRLESKNVANMAPRWQPKRK